MLGTASALASLVGALLDEVNLRDALSFGVAAVFLLAIGLAASLPPVRWVFSDRSDDRPSA